MCMMVYLAGDLPLREVAWNEDAPAFNASPLAPNDQRVLRQFSKPHVIYAGSHEGCGCGFQLGEYPAEYVDPVEMSRQRQSLRQFAAYLREETARVGALEVFACWDGDQEAVPEHQRVLTPSSIESDSFFFLEKELSIIAPEAA